MQKALLGLDSKQFISQKPTPFQKIRWDPNHNQRIYFIFSDYYGYFTISRGIGGRNFTPPPTPQIGMWIEQG